MKWMVLLGLCLLVACEPQPVAYAPLPRQNYRPLLNKAKPAQIETGVETARPTTRTIERDLDNMQDRLRNFQRRINDPPKGT